MTQVFARIAVVIFAAISLASCAMTTEIAPSPEKRILQPRIEHMPDGERYIWEFTASGSFDKIEREMSDSLLIITEQVKRIAENR